MNNFLKGLMVVLIGVAGLAASSLFGIHGRRLGPTEQNVLCVLVIAFGIIRFWLFPPRRTTKRAPEA
jgi:hypothetical protein